MNDEIANPLFLYFFVLPILLALLVYWALSSHRRQLEATTRTVLVQFGDYMLANLLKLRDLHSHCSWAIVFLALMSIAPLLEAQQPSRFGSGPCNRLSTEDKIACQEELLILKLQKTPRGRAWLEAKQRLDAEGRDYSASELYDELPSEHQEEITMEAEGVFSGCNANEEYGQFHDCSCVAKKYMDYRVLQGPEPQGGIMNEISKPDIIRECVNEAGVAEHFYRSCVINYGDRKSDIEGYCTCFADSMGKAFREQAVVSDQSMRRLNRESHRGCGGP